MGRGCRTSMLALMFAALGVLGMGGVETMARETQAGNAPDSATLTILHTNDIHGHVRPWRGWEGELAGKTIGGLDRLATAVKRVRAEAGKQNVLLLDAGDALGDTMIAHETKGQAVLQVMKAIGYDVMAMGNHEPDFSAATVLKSLNESGIALVAANVTDRRTGKLFTQPYVIRERGGVKLGILGLAYPNTPLATARKNVAELEYGQDSAGILKHYLPQMRQEGAQLIIVLSHLGLGADKKLAEQAPGIDVIVGGHSHNRMAEATRIGQALIVQAGGQGSDLGRLDLSVKEGRIVGHQRQLMTLDNATVPADPEVASLIDKIEAPFREQLHRPIGEAAAPIVRAQTLAGQDARKRQEQSPADSLFADILREETKSDAALLPGVGYGVAIEPGVITAEDLRNFVPHESKVVTMSLSGGQLRQILEQAVENTYTDDSKVKVGGMIQVSGLSFSYDPQQPPGQRVKQVSIGDRALEPQRRYRVATNSMLAEGGHNYTTFTEGRERREWGSQYEMVISWIKRQGKVQPPTDQRIILAADASGSKASQAQATQPAGGEEIIDPVCRMKLRPEKRKFPTQHAGRTYTFCCEHCQKMFKENPDAYVKPQ